MPSVMTEFAPGATCTALILEAAAAYPDADAVVLPGDRVTYRGFAAGAAEWSRVFIALGVLKGEHVGILLPNGTDFMHVLIGAMLAGAVPVPINARYRGPELAAMLADADLVTVVTTNDAEYRPSLIERLYEALPDLSSAGAPERLSLEQAPRLRNIVATQGPPSPGILQRRALAASAARIPSDEIEKRRRSVRPEDTALILYTSGSTARPKGCMLSHAAIVTQGRLLAGRYQMTARDRIWSPLPMFHVGGISPLMAIASVGGAFLSMRRIEAGPGLAMMASERATIAFALFQTIIADLLQHPSFPQHDLGTIRLMVSNFSLQPPWIRELLADRLPQAVQIGTFGLTETVASACTHSPDDAPDDRLGRLGRPLPGIEVRVIGEDGREVEPGIIGEVLLRGPTLCSGYYKDPEKTAAALRDGWLRTGDRGSLDARGSVMFHGRLKDVLKVGGENVGALEIETVVGQHPAVKGCAVVGVPDPRLEEVPVAFVELQPGAEASEEQIVTFCEGKLASFKIPRRAYFLTEWPMSATKIDKPALVRQLIGGGDRQ
jgi:fatty-acyl-CoA synthase